MSEREDGGQAFPISPVWDDRRGEYAALTSPGMTLRDYFAAAALTVSLGDVAPEELAKQSYQIADAMLKERAK